jgi:acetoacetyl-CoA synthetase
MEMTGISAPLWQPTQERAEQTALAEFAAEVSTRIGADVTNYDQLHQWSVEQRGAFWDCVWDYSSLIGEKGERLTAGENRMPGARFFPDASINFAENLLRRKDDGDAIVFRSENGETTRWSWRDLHATVSRLQQALAASGVKAGDRVAALLPNVPEAVAAMLAVTSLGAIWSSASPDFGATGVLDRFGQIEPKVFLVCDSYFYAGKTIDLSAKIAEIVPRLTSLEQVVVVSYAGGAEAITATMPGAATMADYMAPFAAREVEFTRRGFSEPCFILFSSGTTGVPKCIVHSAGGTLIQHVKEHRLQSDIGPHDRVFYFTTLGWMMWNWLVSALASGATLLLFDGSPFHPSPAALFEFAEEERATFFGTSAKYIDAVKKAEYRPVDHHDLSALRTIASTGSPLAPESFDFVYEAIKPDVHLASISGGTDIVSCFVLGIPTRPVWRGEIQGPGLGMAMDVFNEAGQPVREEKGELVCKQPFPSMPVGFWDDPDGARYHAAYFERFPGVWAHGDFAEITSHNGMIIHGRSDSTLNPGGVRIGTAEIYRQVEKLSEVSEALAIGQQWNDDERIVLFVQLRQGVVLDEALIKSIRAVIRQGATPRHVPAKVIAVADIPRTKSGKLVELAVREVVHGRPVHNREALANPQALELYENLASLRV